MFDLAEQRLRRRPSLTPMIDVVFLLLVFFMLAARFGQDHAITLGAGGGAGDYTGPPRLIEATADGVLLNGIAMPETALASALAPLMQAPSDVLVLRSRDGATTQRVVDILMLLDDAGFTAVALVE
ncbi:ExbD/TolR family protein [Algicella marina]|uniref:Biopolymer transporter ExbD n=1 Tax=Algicella marina TaxID=2683284 RepID=A0A6P1T5G8_9RHOB|nr:biopolymer transporter ExbD [Algicella marina]QHQ37041.1 biopolymer transporter ExbD [Algicella marina]